MFVLRSMQFVECLKMPRYWIAVICLLLPWLAGAHARISGTADGSEQWGYIDVRPGAHMFWWWYRSTSQASNIPVIMWLQGGPGGSGVGVGDFREIGPLNDQLQPRKYSWVEIADLLFVENPVGTGFSYVDEPSLLATNNAQIAADLLQCLKEIIRLRPDFSKRPFFIFSESYGGKYASEFGVVIHEAIAAGNLDLNFEGVALGDAWISPLDSMYSWGNFLHTNSRLDANSAALVNQNVDETAEYVRNRQFEKATISWSDVSDLVSELSNQVDFYNILDDDEAATSSSATTMSTTTKRTRVFRNYFRDFDAVKVGELDATRNVPLPQLMNTVIRQKLQIIPASVRWETSSEEVFSALTGDFMKDTIHHVDELLRLGIKVAVYNGQLDLICATPGAEAWVQKLKRVYIISGGMYAAHDFLKELAHCMAQMEWIKKFNEQVRTPLYCNSTSTGGFVKKYKNLSFFWILNAGHFLPVDSPCVAQQMAHLITS